MSLPPESHPPDNSQPNDAPAEELRGVAGDAADAPTVRESTGREVAARQDVDQEPVLAEQVASPAEDQAREEHALPLPSEALTTGLFAEKENGGSGAEICANEATAGHPTDRTRARWWSPLAVAGLSLAVFIFTSGIMAVLALFIVHGKISPEVLRHPEPMQKVSESRLGLFIVIVIPQIALVIPCLVAAFLSPVPFRERLGLVRGNWPVWTWPAVAAATPLVGMVSGLVVGLFLDESDALKQMTEIFRGHGQNGFLFPLALMIGATPAICEELLFRGYIQRRLTRSLGPVLGIGIASFLFAAFHLDLVHVIAVLPLGLFLGWVSWQSGSLFPAILGHFVNNVISVVGIVVAPEENPDVLALPAVALTLGIFAMGVLGMAVVSVVSIAYRRTEPGELSAGETQLAS